jgi:holo-[acyl-carrier protein] synthase
VARNFGFVVTLTAAANDPWSGNDLIDIRRIEKTIEKHGERFLTGFTPISSAPIRPPAHARRLLCQAFAAKEACAKALGTGLNQGVYWRDMGVVNLPGGKPTWRLTGGALKRLEKNHPAGHLPQIDLTITDDFPLAQAIVIISAVAMPSIG